MASPAEQLGAPESIEPNKAESADVIRNKIAQMVKDPYFQSTLDKEALKNYQDIVDKKGNIDPNDTESLSRFYDFMSNQFTEVQQVKKRITDHVKDAIRGKAISEEDRKFYKEKMKENVVSGEQIVTKEVLEKAEKEILESLENRRKERKEYDDLVDSTLVKDGFLIIDKDNKILVPDEVNYLKMTVPERRKWLKQIQDALPKAERYAEAQEKNEGDKLTKEYETLLNAARKEGMIGDKIIDKFMDWFNGQNNEAKKYAIGQFFKEMSRYKTLWKDIRKTLKGNSLSRLEKLKDQMGHTELKSEFMKEQYAGKLKEARQKKIISKHTETAFLADFESQSPDRKQNYLDQFDNQMEKYKSLCSRIDQMKDKKAQKVLNEMYEIGQHGFSEIHAKYNRLTGSQISEADKNTKPEPSLKGLSTITNETVKKEILHARKTLNRTEKKTFVERLTHFFSGRESERQDTVSYQDNVRASRKKHERAYQENVTEGSEPPIENEGLKGAHQNLEIHDIDENAVERTKSDTQKKPRTINPTKSSDVRIKKSKDRAYQQNMFLDERGQKRRVVRVGGTKEAVRAFNNEALLNRDKDELSIMSKDGSNIVEMKMREIRVMKDVLKKSLEEDKVV